jgi:hypothetical protein
MTKLTKSVPAVLLRAMAEEKGGTALILMTVVAAPIALVLETILRKLLFPPEFDELRLLFEPTLTPVVWGLVVLTALFGAAGIALQARLAARAVRKVPEHARTPARIRKAELGAFMLAASIPQIPAILATLGFMWGSSLTPVIVAIGVATVAIVVQAVRARSR